MSADGDVHSTGPEALDLDRLAVVEAELAGVEHAMGRLDAGTWGTCEVCAGPIEATVLERQPAARSCIAHTGVTAR